MKETIRRTFYQAIYLGKSKIRVYLRKFTGKRILPCTTGRKRASDIEINNALKCFIESGSPFMLGRMGATEMACVRTLDFHIESKYQTVLDQMHEWSGFFENTLEAGFKYLDLTKEAFKVADMLIYWEQPYYEYYIKKYSPKNTLIGDYDGMIPFLVDSKTPWTAALKGKKVVVVHPFSELIESQYKKRELLFPGTNILPEFELRTVKAVQTIAGNVDERFKSWFDALEWMYDEVIKEDFDVAIIGCGAYGFPLAAMIKRYGKQAIHMAGRTQLLFGIKGSRWENLPSYVNVWNQAWVWPDKGESVEGVKRVEDGCYW